MSDYSKQKINTYIKPLDRAKDYELWALRLDSLLARKGLIEYINTQDYNLYYPVEGETGLTPAKGVKAASVIKLNLIDGPLLQIRYITKPYKLWTRLKDLYGSKGFNSEFLLYKELFDTTLSTSGNRMEVYLNTIKRLTDELVRSAEGTGPEWLKHESLGYCPIGLASFWTLLIDSIAYAPYIVLIKQVITYYFDRL